MTITTPFTPSDVNLARVQQELNTLAQFGRRSSGGVSRFTFDDAHQKATFQVAGWMNQAGLTVSFDRWGNLYGRTPGVDDDASVILTGSHLDSVPNGGHYDGPLGVLSSLEAVRLILESGVKLNKPIEAMSFIEEEGTTFRGLFGSLLATGGLDDEEIAAVANRDGERFLDILNSVNFPYPLDAEKHYRDGADCYLEVHIEQGKRLVDAGVPIGIVTGIAGPNFMRVCFSGRSDHAGATAYGDRQDTLLATAEVILKIRKIGVARFEGRGHMTVGRINVKPNAANVIAGETDFAVDFRAADAQAAVEMREAVETILREVGDKHPISYEVVSVESVPPMQTPQRLKDAVEQGAKQAGVDSVPMISWAAHDAMVMARVADAGMIFVPSQGGRSHCPEEFTTPEDIAAGIATLANALVTLAE
jgi:allantoate deiminase